MKKWLTLTGYCIVNMVNAMGFGILSDNHQQLADYYNMSLESFSSLFYVGLFIEILFCFPAMKVIEWRLDYSIHTAAFLTVCGNCINLFSIDNIVIAYASQLLLSFGQLFTLPSSMYLA